MVNAREDAGLASRRYTAAQQGCSWSKCQAALPENGTDLEMLLVCAGSYELYSLGWAALLPSAWKHAAYEAESYHHAAALHLFGLQDLLVWLHPVVFACTSRCALNTLKAKCWCASRGRWSPHTSVSPSLQGEGPVHHPSHQSKTHEATDQLWQCLVAGSQ